MIDQKSERELVEECNQLARAYYKMLGCEVNDDFKFYEAHHPAEVNCWNMAVMAYDHILGTDIENCLAEIEGEASDLTSFQ